MSIKIDSPGITIICGLQGSGKSHLIKYLLYQMRKKFDWGIVFTQTGFAGDNFDYIPKQFIHAKFSVEALVSLKNIHKKLIEAGKKPSAFIILDDILFGNHWKNEVFLNIMTQVRHWGLTVLLSCQYPQSIPIMIRTNAFQVAVFGAATARALKGLFESYGQMFNSYEEFRRYIMDNTGNHCFVWYNSRGTQATVEGRYSVMQCPAEIPHFLLKFKTKI